MKFMIIIRPKSQRWLIKTSIALWYCLVCEANSREKQVAVSKDF